jgi:hypothetical protein
VQSYRLLREALVERNYFLKATPFQSKEVKLFIPTPSLIEALAWHFPALVLYHLIYIKQLMKTNYQESFSPPNFKTKGAIVNTFPKIKNVHGWYGTVLHEG